MAILLSFAGGLVLLIAGAEWLVRGSSRLAAALGVPPVIIGLTVVAFATSSPELSVEIKSVFSGRPDLALGDLIGSNIFNTLFIAGVSALAAPLLVAGQLVRLDIPIMIGVSFLVIALSLDGQISRTDGVLLFTGLLAYISLCVHLSREQPGKVQRKFAEALDVNPKARARQTLRNLGLMALGLGMLLGGSHLLVQAAVSLAQSLGVGELIIGLLLIAPGTGLPEVATSVMASLRGQREIAVGNLVGSNIFNLLCVLGITSIVAPGPIPVAADIARLDLPVMLGAGAALYFIVVSAYRIRRWEGGLLLFYYLAYVIHLMLRHSEHGDYGILAQLWLVLILPLLGLSAGFLAFSAARTGIRRARRR